MAKSYCCVLPIYRQSLLVLSKLNKKTYEPSLDRGSLFSLGSLWNGILEKFKRWLQEFIGFLKIKSIVMICRSFSPWLKGEISPATGSVAACLWFSNSSFEAPNQSPLITDALNYINHNCICMRSYMCLASFLTRNEKNRYFNIIN